LATWPNSGSRAVGAALQSRGGDGFAPSSRTRSSRVDVDGLKRNAAFYDETLRRAQTRVETTLLR
jgi:hypothetical protein